MWSGTKITGTLRPSAIVPTDLKTVIGTNATRAPGCKETGSNGDGMNRPLQSPHPGGILAGMVDGSVQFVSATTGLEVLLRLAIRMDGQTVKLQ